MEAKKTMTLRKWIQLTGVNEVARATRADRSAVRHWARGYVLPRDEKKLIIRNLSNGAVTFDEMIERYFSKANKNNRRIP